MSLPKLNNDYVCDNAYSPGTHLLIDLWNCENLSNLELIKSMLHEAATTCGATILETKLHQFGGHGGITGVIILAESHISIHTWPEKSYAAIDVFMCGDCKPEKSIEIFEKHLKTTKKNVIKHARGIE